MCSGPSAAEQQAAANTAAFTEQLQGEFETEFSEQQAISSFLSAQLEPMITNPTGFTPQQMSDLNSNLINNVGAQVVQAKQALNAQQMTENEAGLPSGVASADSAAIAAAGINAEAAGLNQNQLASASLAEQKQQSAEEMMLGLSSQAAQLTSSAGNQALVGNEAAFNEQSAIAQQSTQFWSNLMGGIIGAGTSFLTGLPFMGGGGSGGGTGTGSYAGPPVPGYGAPEVGGGGSGTGGGYSE